MRRSLVWWLGVWLLQGGVAAAMVRPYVTLHDDGTIQKLTSPTVASISAAFMKIYDASGAPRPNVISVWTGFEMGGEGYGTFFLPQANAIQGIGFDSVYGGKGLFKSAYGPLNAILLHNTVLELPKRITENRATSDPAGYAQYLFLLEFSHQWLAAVEVPGSKPHDLGTYPHWSFWYSSGDSPPGGNVWSDNGDGTFSTVPVNPAEVKYSNLDLYLMGLVDAGAVGSFEVLENPVAPSTPTDPVLGGKFSAASLTDFDQAPLKVTATAKTYTIGDIIAANGARNPPTSPNNSTVGFVLLVPQDAGPDEVAADQAVFDPISVTLAPAFERATGGIATLTVVTDGGEMPEDAGVDAGEGDDGGTDAGALDDAGVSDAGGPSSAGKSGCATGSGEPALLFILAAILLASRRRRPR